MEDKLIELLETFGFPVFRQGTLADDEPYPDDFFTFWENDSYDGSHYNNENISTIWNYDVNFYSSNPENVYSKLKEAIKLLKKNSFIISGKGHDVATDPDNTTHTGRGTQILYLEMED